MLFDRTVLDNLGYCLQRGWDVPAYMTNDAAAEAVARIDFVFVLDQVASAEEIERRNRETGRKTDPKASVAMSKSLEEVRAWPGALARTYACQRGIRIPAGVSRTPLACVGLQRLGGCEVLCCLRAGVHKARL